MDKLDPEAAGQGIDAASPATRPYPNLRRDLRAMHGDGVSFSLMVGIGETYLPAFVLAIGLGELAAGLITTIPLLAGALLQLISPYAVRRLGSHRRWVVACAALQALAFLPLCVAALAGRIPVVVAFMIAAVYWGAGLGTTAAWNSWAQTLVPPHMRARYFSRRSRAAQMGVLVGFLIGGLALQIGTQRGHLLGAFALLFFLAFCFRSASATFLFRTSESRPLADGHRSVSPRELLRRLRHSGDGRLLVYLLLMQTGVMISGPYFTPYMLGALGLSYAQYVLLIATSFAAKIVALPAFGHFAQRWGPRRLLWVGGLGIIPVSSLWIFSSRFEYLILVQLTAGITWAAYELAMFLMFFETIAPEERTSVLTTYNLGNALATVTGSLLGGGLLLWLGKSPSTYWLLFGLSSLVRASTVPGLVQIANVSLRPRIGVRFFSRRQEASLATRTLGVRVTDGSLDQPILPSLATEEPELSLPEGATAEPMPDSPDANVSRDLSS